MNHITLFLTLAASGRPYYTAKQWITHSFKTPTGRVLEMLAPKSTADLTQLPDGAITAILCPNECIGHTLEDLTDPEGEFGLPETIDIDYTTGAIIVTD